METSLSIIIPFFNSENTINRSVDSVISQLPPSWELILVNDGSKDKSSEIAKSYLKDTRINFFSQDNKGVSAARNYGASKAKGDWLFFLDSDDYLEEKALSIIEHQISCENHQSFFIFGINRIKIHSIVAQIPERGKYFSKLAGSFIIKKSVFDHIGGYDQRLKYSENTELFHRVSLAGFSGSSVPRIILNYFDNPVGGSKNLQNMIVSLTLILEKHSETLSPHVKHLYYQIIGVNWMRFRNFSKARYNLYFAIKYEPKKISTWARLILACFPFFAKRLYSETVNHG